MTSLVYAFENLNSCVGTHSVKSGDEECICSVQISYL